MTYVDGFVLPVKKRQLATYRSMAKQAGKVTAQFARNLEAALGGDRTAPGTESTATPAAATGARPALRPSVV